MSRQFQRLERSNTTLSLCVKSVLLWEKLRAYKAAIFWLVNLVFEQTYLLIPAYFKTFC